MDTWMKVFVMGLVFGLGLGVAYLFIDALNSLTVI